MKIAVYLSGVPSKAENQFKRMILTKFAYGAKKAGDEVYLVDQLEPIDADVAVIQGWVNSKKSPHLALRSNVIEKQRRDGKHIIAIDSNLYGFLAPEDFNRYLRYSVGDVFPDRGYYFDQNIDPLRWFAIKSNYGFQERNWNTQGRHILANSATQRRLEYGNMPVQQWLDDILPKIRAVSDRPVVLRPHPGNLEIVPTIRMPKLSGVSWSSKSDIRKDLDQAWATITYNSSPGVASLLWGVPVWVTDPAPNKSQAWPYANTDLAQIENPVRPDREEFYHKLAQCHWNADELDSGAAWQFMRQRLPKI